MNALFHQDVVVATLASGSRGNCTYVGDGRRGVLVDCGLSTRQVMRRLDAIGLGDSRIDAVLLTHEHSDHVGAARVLDKHLLRVQGQRVPFYLTRGTDIGLDPRCRPVRVERVQSGRPFQVGGWTIEPTTVPHDTLDPVSYLVQVGEVAVGVLTDLGRSTRLVERQLARLDVAVVEFNHDLQMLLDGAYPWPLKQRVRGPHGHLSNDQAADLVRAAASDRLRHLVLAHLSDDNNLPEVARRSAEVALWDAGRTSCEVHVAAQGTPVGPMRVTTPTLLRQAPTSGPSTRQPRAARRAAPRPRVRDDSDSARQISLF